MEFLEISEEEYTKYWENSEYKTFLSSPKISKLREKSGWKTNYVGVKENNKLIGAAMLLSHDRHFGVKEFYSPRGFLFDYNNKELLDFFYKEAKKYVKSKKGYILRVDPYVIYKERDNDGEIVENGINNESVVNNLKSLGFKKVSVENREQVAWMFSLYLEGKTEEQILKEMKPNWRNNIRKTEKIGINVRELKFDELGEFQRIMEETGARKGFSVRKQSYFEEMYNLFHDTDEVKYFITSLNLRKYIDDLLVEKQEKLDKIDSLSDSPKNEGLKNNLRNDIAGIDKRVSEAEEIIKEKNTEEITLSGSMFMLIEPEVIYLSSGNYEEYLKYNSQYLIQWELIKYGIAHGFKKHNFYGIPDNINTHPKDYGIYEFKKGFNGVVEELIGEYELPITVHYNLFKLLHKLKGNK